MTTMRGEARRWWWWRWGGAVVYMAVWWWTFATISMTSAGRISQSDLDEERLVGTWTQMYSNRYVQQMEEIGWQCVMSNVSFVNTTTTTGDIDLHVSKWAWFHGNRSDMVQRTMRWRLPSMDRRAILTNDTHPILFESPEDGKVYQLRDFNTNYDYLLWTASDDMSLYVWTKNVVDFKVNHDWVVLEKFTFWNYTGYYKFPLPSYSFKCMVSQNDNDEEGMV